MRKLLILTVLLVYTINSFSQKVFVNPKDYTEKKGLVFAKVKVGPKYINTELSENLSVVDNQGNHVKIKKDSVWGYETNKGKVYRLRETNSIQLIDNSNLYIYEFASLYWSSFFFSTSLDSKIYRLNRRNLLAQSMKKDCMNEVLNRLDSIDKKVKSRVGKSDRFYINEILSKLNCNPFR